jgi:hypothetical protein
VLAKQVIDIDHDLPPRAILPHFTSPIQLTFSHSSV